MATPGSLDPDQARFEERAWVRGYPCRGERGEEALRELRVRIDNRYGRQSTLPTATSSPSMQRIAGRIERAGQTVAPLGRSRSIWRLPGWFVPRGRRPVGYHFEFVQDSDASP